MLIRWTFLCAAVAALTACAGVAPDQKTGAKADTAKVVYPSEHNQFREIGWE